MRFIVSICCLVIVWGATVNKGQETKEPSSTRRAVVVPRNTGLATIASQPDSPLQIESAVFLAYLGGGGGEVFRVRNRGSKPIRNYTVAILSLNDTGWQTDWPTAVANGLLMPGELTPGIEKKGIEIVPLTENLREQLNLDGPMQGLSVVMTVRVEFVDGTHYDDTSTFKALQAYFKDVATKVDRASRSRTQR